MSISPPISIPAAPAFGSFRDWGRASRASEPDSIRPDGILSASWRANGSRECAPDDRLREAIQSDTARLDCLVADAPRNDELRIAGTAKQDIEEITRCLQARRSSSSGALPESDLRPPNSPSGRVLMLSLPR